MELQQELNQLLGAPAPAAAAEPTTKAPQKRKFSAAAKARMRKAQKEGWAKIRAAATTPIPEAPKKSRLSDQGVANIHAGIANRMEKKGTEAVVTGKKPKGKVSPALNTTRSEAMKASWAARKATLKTKS